MIGCISFGSWTIPGFVGDDLANEFYRGVIFVPVTAPLALDDDTLQKREIFRQIDHQQLVLGRKAYRLIAHCGNDQFLNILVRIKAKMAGGISQYASVTVWRADTGMGDGLAGQGIYDSSRDSPGLPDANMAQKAYDQY